MERRRELRQHERFIVDPIFPCGALHILTGPSGIGKTTWLFQQLRDWEQGKDVLGRKSYPCEWVYVSLDRSQMDGDRTLRRLGFADWDAPVYAMEDVVSKVGGRIEEPTIFQIEKRFPNCSLYVVEGLQGLLPNTGRGQSQNKAEQIWALQIRREILNGGKTIIATTHSPKMTEGYKHNRENMLGSQALIGAAGTIVHFALPDNGGRKSVVQPTDRVVTVMGHDFPDMYLHYSRGASGEFVLDDEQIAGQAVSGQPEGGEKKRIMNRFLAECAPGTEIKYADIQKWARSAGMGSSSMNNWRNEQTEAGTLLKEGRGAYRRSSIVVMDVASIQ